ncbi:hypothetical protein E0H26_28680 [Micromonospora zingiberis]|uniref:Uncharacterized protein n=1 Tax=Micromonospora zingiberis TaxID=2053011 RepID=A0A4R0FWU9_9ACTN|nr:hypothetical protein [Micromonospora zingiberis]TCB87872.1 hypothetical protein E0H26_28680 [Micromonospora zingiberis]
MTAPPGRPPTTTGLKAGDLLRVTAAASVQFHTPMLFRVIRELDWVTYDGWVWVDGYQLDSNGQAVARRSIFVQRAGLALLRRQVLHHAGGPRPQPAATRW